MAHTRTIVMEFARPFALDALDGLVPAGRYEVETEEEQIQGISIIAYRRLSTSIRLPGTPGSLELSRVVSVDPEELAAASIAEPPARNASIPAALARLCGQVTMPFGANVAGRPVRMSVMRSF